MKRELHGHDPELPLFLARAHYLNESYREAKRYLSRVRKMPHPHPHHYPHLHRHYPHRHRHRHRHRHPHPHHCLQALMMRPMCGTYWYDLALSCEHYSLQVLQTPRPDRTLPEVREAVNDLHTAAEYVHDTHTHTHTLIHTSNLIVTWIWMV